MRTPSVILACVAASASWTACEREQRRLQQPAPLAERSGGVVMSPLAPGGGTPSPNSGTAGPNDRNAFAISEGSRLYNAFNCSGCHANGGGGIGPPLMDKFWIYGSDPQNIYASIVEGRPNGMPSFRGKIPENQVWQLVSYVRSLSGNVAYDALPSRNDHMAVKKSGALTPEEQPKAGQ